MSEAIIEAMTPATPEALAAAPAAASLTQSDPVARARALTELVAAHADHAEAERRLPAAVARAFAEQGLYRMAAPLRCGGADETPMTQIETIATVAAADGSAGWNLMIGVESFGLIAPELGACADLIADPMTVLCSSTAAVGRADAVPGGYRVSGQWPFVSGCHNAHVFGATVQLHDNGQPVPGAPLVYAMLPQGDYAILDTWDVSGMRGSGSHDVRVDGAFVPTERIVASMGGGRALTATARAVFPLAPRLAYNKVAVAIGIARAATDCFGALARGKIPRFTSHALRDRATAQRAAAMAEVRVAGARAQLLAAVESLWSSVQSGALPAPRELATFQALCSLTVSDLCVAVDQLADAAGTTANFRGHPLDRASRDIRVVRQHASVASHHIEDAGRVLLGLRGTGLMLRGLEAL
ncbi:MAG: acyl-CoA dehydrogenase family protein [Gammaproteobacteria bacterium]